MNTNIKLNDVNETSLQSAIDRVQGGSIYASYHSWDCSDSEGSMRQGTGTISIGGLTLYYENLGFLTEDLETIESGSC